MIYLDNNATTKISKHVYFKQCEILNKFYGNPSSLYPLGVSIADLIADARRNIASFIRAENTEDRIIFTSCATESNNSVLHSALFPQPKGKHIVISRVEHPSVLNAAAYYQSLGCRVSYADVNQDGELDEAQLAAQINEDTVLVSVMLVNSETGVIHNVSRIAEAVKRLKPDVLVHTDAVQAAGKIPIDVAALGVDFLTLSGHKFHAPKGVGALYVKSGVKFIPLLHGGHQEGGLRAGTENTASIVAMGEAAVLAREALNSGAVAQIKMFRDKMELQLKRLFPDSVIFGEKAPRVGNTTNIGFRGIPGSMLVLKLADRGICVSSGTACNSKSTEPSQVLRAMRAPDEFIHSIRISLSSETKEDEIHGLLSALREIISK